MKFVDGWWFPDHEQHMIDWMATPKARMILNGRAAYQGAKQKAVLKHCTRFRTFVDVGAHIGTWSYNMAREFAWVEAFEPVAAHRECFYKNAGARNVTMNACALGERASMVSIHTRSTSSGDSWVSGGGDIPVHRLDDFEFADVDLIKIDTEGFELFVLRGAEETIKRYRPCVMVEQKGDMASKRFGLKQKGAVDYLLGLGAVLRAEISGDYILSFP